MPAAEANERIEAARIKIIKFTDGLVGEDLPEQVGAASRT